MDVSDDFVGRVETDIVVATTFDPAPGRGRAGDRGRVNTKGARYNVSQGAFVAISRMARSRRWSAAGLRASQFNRATEARASRAPPSSPSSISPRWSAA